MTQVGLMQYATIDLTGEEHERYYNDFSNGTLWPLLHSMPGDMGFDRRSARLLPPGQSADDRRIAAAAAPD